MLTRTNRYIHFTFLFRCYFAYGKSDELVLKEIGSIFEEVGFSPHCVSKALTTCEESSINISGTNEIKSQLKDLNSKVKTLTSASEKPRNCADLLRRGYNTSGVHKVYPYTGCNDKAVYVYCDQETDGGGWTLFQHREDFPERENFFRKWVEYKLGFGNLYKEFWLGLDNIHALVTDYLMEMRIDLEDFDGNKRWAKYEFFYITDESAWYRLDLGEYNGDAGDGFNSRHIGFKFSTKDRDNDDSTSNCANKYKGAWWYDQCHISNLNGYPYKGNHASHADGINWSTWLGYKYSLKKTSMSIRPKFGHQQLPSNN